MNATQVYFILGTPIFLFLLLVLGIKLYQYRHHIQERKQACKHTQALCDALNENEFEISERLKGHSCAEPRLPAQFKQALKLIQAGKDSKSVIQYCQLTQSEIELLHCMQTMKTA